MEIYLFLFVLISTPILWIISIFIFKEWKYFGKLFLINTIILICYGYLILYTNLNFVGHDEYGLGKILLLVSSLIIHTILNFGLALFYKYKLKKAN